MVYHNYGDGEGSRNRIDIIQRMIARNSYQFLMYDTEGGGIKLYPANDGKCKSSIKKKNSE